MGAATEQLINESPAWWRHHWVERAWKVFSSVSVRTKILGIVLALTVILGVGVTLQVRLAMEHVFMRELESRGLSVVSDLAARSIDPILLNDTYGVYELLTGTVQVNPDVLYAFVLAENRRVLAHTFGDEGFPIDLLNVARPDDSGANPIFRFDSSAGRVHEFHSPVFDGRAGYLYLGMTENRLRSVINGVTGQLLLTTLLVAIIGIVAATFLTWVLTRPIVDLVATTRAVGKGEMNARAPHWADDEIGSLADAFNQMVADLAASRAVIADKDAARTRLLEQLITAQEEERKRIARELHDGVGQTLTSFIWGLHGVTQAETLPTAHSQGEMVRGQARDLLQQVRVLSRQLRPSVLDDLGLAAALARYMEEFRNQHPHLTVDLHCDLPERLPALVEITLYRIVQEAMTNAARHAGANTLSVLVTAREGNVQAIVEDNGCGFDPAAARRAGQSVGLHGMTERAELIGGRLDIESGPDGTAVYVEATL